MFLELNFVWRKARTSDDLRKAVVCLGTLKLMFPMADCCQALMSVSDHLTAAYSSHLQIYYWNCYVSCPLNGLLCSWDQNIMMNASTSPLQLLQRPNLASGRIQKDFREGKSQKNSILTKKLVLSDNSRIKFLCYLLFFFESWGQRFTCPASLMLFSLKE